MPSLPTPRSEPRCKLCQLQRQHVRLWAEVHHKVVKEGMSHSVVCAWLNSQVEVYNASCEEGNELPEFNKPNFTTHFHRHIVDTKGLLKLVEKNLKQEVSPLNASEQLVLEAVAQPPEMTDYHDLNRKVGQYEKMVDVYMGKAAPGAVTPVQLETVQRAVEGLANLRLSMMKFRHDSRLASLAVSTAMGLCAAAAIEAFDRALDKHQGIPMEEIVEMKKEVADGMGVAVNEIRQKIAKEFNLK